MCIRDRSNYYSNVTVSTENLNPPSDPIWNKSYASNVIGEITITNRDISVDNFNDFASTAEGAEYYVTINGIKKTFGEHLDDYHTHTWANLNHGSTDTLKLQMMMIYPSRYSGYDNYLSDEILYDITTKRKRTISDPITIPITDVSDSLFGLVHSWLT